MKIINSNNLTGSEILELPIGRENCPTTYRVKPGDTFDSIALKKYGSSGPNLIKEGNPGVEILNPGMVLIIPDKDVIKNVNKNRKSDTLNEVSLLLEGERYRFWTEIKINRAIDTIDTVVFSSPLSEDNRDKFKPLSFQEVSVIVGGENFFGGTLINPTPSFDKEKIVSANCYAKSGVLQDCHPPSSMYPIEFNKQKLEQIAEKMTAPFGVKVTFEDDSGAVFERVACDPGKKVLQFLIELAKERGLLIFFR